MRVLGEYLVDSIIPLIQDTGTTQLETPNHGLIPVRVCTPRLKRFKHERQCVWCGCVGNLFRLETQLDIFRPHLNLYCRDFDPDGNLRFRLMTADHIVPRSLSGSSHRDNLAVMCEEHNKLKANMLPVFFVQKMITSEREINEQRETHI